ncbi:hypothetical protein HW130_18625 [Streptomyces sp. PKU-EA00015]|uniref:hypothetical protein n=1 Tax=Streptomyces sp. PKU-EA00015 TaxID=2748326 RepID=UPI0015A18FE9|nr:hypothetical protein [Streptomyces sp. PKU-EA00015]NWF28259.1 hypothetical protein [Streptomyces sp. PKU-EA00015]
MDVTITVRVCDICKRRDRPATRYTLTADEAEPRERDLCDEDAAPLLDLFGGTLPEPRTEALVDAVETAVAEEAGTARPRNGRQVRTREATAEPEARPRRSRRTPVATLEEIEAMKAAKAAES